MLKIREKHATYLGIVICLGFMLGTPWVLGTMPGGDYADQRLRQNMAAHLLSRHDIVVRPAEMVIPGANQERASSLLPTEVYFLGKRQGEANRDLFFAHIIHSKKAVPVHASPAFSLSRTEGADEAHLVHDKRRYLAYASRIRGKVSVITVLDLRGQSREATDTFTATQRLQQVLTNWQDTGLWRGLDRLEVRLPLPQEVTLRWTKQGLVIRQRAGRWEAVVDPTRARVVRGPARVRRVRVGQRSFIAWAVDTVRSLSFVGPERIAWLEEQVYGLVDQARRMSGAEVTASEIQDEMALPVVAAASHKKIEGWPPPPLRPMLRKTLPGEGKWSEVKGPFVRGKKDEPGLFAMSFVRPDAERLFARVYFVAWDPRRVELRMVAGTREPRSSTGFRGTGMIPRRPEVLRRLVATFNGGFQSIHGDYGMMLDRKLLLPARPWAATVTRMADGSTGLGTWPGTARHGWTPPWMRDFRQNLTALVEAGKANPWRRGSWGGALATAKKAGPEFRVIRSALCLHKSGHLMYVQGQPLDGQMMGKAMHAVGCTYGMMLDINTTHVGFEFYNVRLPGEKPQHDAHTFKPQKYLSTRGKYPRLEGHTYTMRAATRSHYNRMPRWINREARDFFYLVRRDHMPGKDLEPLGTTHNEGRWTAATLPRGALAFPQSMARAFLQSEGKRRVHLVNLDMRWLDARICLPTADQDCLPVGKGDVLAVLPLGRFHEERGLWADGKALAGAGGGRAHLTLESLRPGGPAFPSVTKTPDGDRGAVSVEAAAPGDPGQVQAALCVPESSRGRLLYATTIGAGTEQLEAAMTRAGCKTVISLGAAEPMVLAGDSGLRSVHGDAFPPVAGTPSLVLRRSRARWASRIFTHVKVQPRKVWLAVQPERTRSVQLRRANRAIAKLGLPPIRTLRYLCRKPYIDVDELRQYHWRDPVTKRRLCSKKKRKKKRKR